MKKLVFILSALFAFPAYAQGVYGNASGCALYGETGGRDENAVFFDQSDFVFYESFCKVTDAAESSGRTVYTTSCFGGGAEWDLSFVLEPTSNAETFLFYSPDSPDRKESLDLCK